jgi:hypothetical protein
MSDEGYINTDNKDKEKEIKREYNDLIRELRFIIHSNSRSHSRSKTQCC